jgi:hypothetical protein
MGPGTSRLDTPNRTGGKAARQFVLSGRQHRFCGIAALGSFLPGRKVYRILLSRFQVWSEFENIHIIRTTRDCYSDSLTIM